MHDAVAADACELQLGVVTIECELARESTRLEPAFLGELSSF